MDSRKLDELRDQIRGLSEEDRMKLGFEFELGKETRKLAWWWIVLPFIALGVFALAATIHLFFFMIVGMAAAAAAGGAAYGAGGSIGGVARAYSDYHATRYATDRQLKWEKYKAEQARAAQEFTAEQARLAKERAAEYGYEGQVEAAEYGYKGQVKSAKFGYLGQVRASELGFAGQATRAAGGVYESGMQVGGNVVVAGFGQFNASQRMGTQWAYRSNDKVEVVKRFFIASLLFVGGMFVLALALDWFGFPILKNLIDLVVETIANGLARMNVIQSLAEAGNVEGAKAWMSSTGGAVAGGFIGVVQRFFEGIMNFFAKAGAAIANAFGSLGSAIGGAVG